MKVAVGMSGGVDSSVAALLLKRAGHEVTGITMKLWPGPPQPGTHRSACYGPDEAEDLDAAAEVASRLGIPLRVFDCSGGYADLVVKYFREEYLGGRTPNPCVRCNPLVKFGMLPRLAKDAGLPFDAFATGHYARVGKDAPTGRFLLRRAVDARKDQSYFLYRLSQDQLAATLFPLGDLEKTAVRGIALGDGLPVHDKEDSQDFYSGDLQDILQAAPREGDIVDRAGKVLGRHSGTWNYTVGQRKGLGIAHSEPLYVLSIDAANNRLVVGPEDETFARSCTVCDCVWGAIPALVAPECVQVKVRSTSRLVDATIAPAGDTVLVSFAEPVSSVTPGQSAVFYRRDGAVMGGGIIASPSSAEAGARAATEAWESGFDLRRHTPRELAE